MSDAPMRAASESLEGLSGHMQLPPCHTRAIRFGRITIKSREIARDAAGDISILRRSMAIDPAVARIDSTRPSRCRPRWIGRQFMMLDPGTLIGHYEIKAQLGAGGMGEVYRATDRRLGRDVALKVLPAALVTDPERRKRLEREARTVAALNHQNIVTIHSVEEEGGIQFITMELVVGQP